MPTAHGEFEVKAWEEQMYAEIGTDRKLTRATVTQVFTGDLQGDGAVEWLMCYRADGTAEFVGLQQIEGQLAGREGSFVLKNVGAFDGTVATGTWTVVPGLSTGDLTTLQGHGEFGAPHGPKATFSLEYSFD